MRIGIDVGGTNIAVGLVNDKNRVVYSSSRPTKSERSFEMIVNDMADLVNEVIEKGKASKSEIKGIGIGVPGMVDPETGSVIEVVNMGWYNVDLKGTLEKILNIPVKLGNDATVAGLAEYKVGVMKGHKSGILFTLGTGIGGGIIINGKVYDGAHGIGSEIGHMIVGENYYDCNCGRNGCLETFCSSTAIIKYANKLISEGNESSMVKMVDGHLSKIDGRVIFDAAKAGDEVATLVVDRMVKYLAIGIVNIMCVIDPEVFVLGGGLSAAGDFLLDKVRQAVEKYRYFRGVPAGKVMLSEIGNDAGIVGAAALID